jgi:hypothetical protein
VGLEAGHEQRGVYAFSANVGEDEPDLGRAEFEEIEIVAADGPGLYALRGAVEGAELRRRLGQEAGLDFLGDLHLAGDAALGFHPLRDLFGQADILQRGARLTGDGGEQAAVLAGVGLFGEAVAAISLTRKLSKINLR